MATLTIADLDNGKRDLQTVDEVANSRAATATTRFGQQTTTLYEAIRRINVKGDEILSNLGFRVPVPYASGLNVTDSRFTVTGPDGKVYAPLSAPFTTGAWDPAQWYVLQNELNDRKLLVFGTFAEARAASTTLPDGQPIVAGGLRMEVQSGYLSNTYGTLPKTLFETHQSALTYSDNAGLHSFETDGHQWRGDMRGALYEAGVPNAVWFSDDLKVSIGGEIYANRQGWQRCRGKRYGRIVVYGSSTPAGVGTSDYFPPSADNGWTESPNSWVGLMRAALGNAAEVINRSSSGEDTTRGIDMFWRNVAPYSPDTVILSFGFVNEGSGEVVRRANDVLSRYLRLCSMCSRIGAKPVVVVSMAGNTQDLLHTYSIASALREHGIAVWDISCAVKDINSDAIAADYQYDTTHANNAGHLRYFQNINISDLDLDLRSAGKSQIQSMLGKNLAYEVVAAAGSAPLEATFTESRPLDFCAYIRVKRMSPTASNTACLLNIQGFSSTEHPILSVRSATGNWGLYADSVLVLRSEVAVSTDAEAELCLSYDRGRNRVDFYANGTLVGSHTPSKSPTSTAGWAWFRFGQTNTGDFRAVEWAIIDAIVTRNPSMNGNGIKSGSFLSNSLPLPSTMGARFGISGASPAFRLTSNPESDLYSRLSVNGVKIVKAP